MNKRRALCRSTPSLVYRCSGYLDRATTTQLIARIQVIEFISFISASVLRLSINMNSSWKHSPLKWPLKKNFGWGKSFFVLLLGFIIVCSAKHNYSVTDRTVRVSVWKFSLISNIFCAIAFLWAHWICFNISLDLFISLQFHSLWISQVCMLNIPYMEWVICF